MIELTKKQKKFADGILEGKNGTDAALDAYDIDPNSKDVRNNAAMIASYNLTTKRVLAYLEAAGYGAASRIVKMSKSAKNETVKLNANKDILDRVGLGVKKDNLAVGVQINFNDDKEQFG